MRSRSLSFGLQVCVGAHDTDGCVSVTDRTLINSFKHGLSLCVCLLGDGGGGGMVRKVAENKTTLFLLTTNKSSNLIIISVEGFSEQ